MIHIDEDEPRKKIHISIGNIVIILVLSCLVVGMCFVLTTAPQKSVPVVTADTTVIPKDAFTMYTGDRIDNGFSEYPILVFSGINHTYNSQVIFTVYTVIGNRIVSTTIYPVLNQTFNAQGVKYKLWAVDWRAETVTVERVS